MDALMALMPLTWLQLGGFVVHNTENQHVTASGTKSIQHTATEIGRLCIKEMHPLVIFGTFSSHFWRFRNDCFIEAKQLVLLKCLSLASASVVTLSL